jgi:hypothetical protein
VDGEEAVLADVDTSRPALCSLPSIVSPHAAAVIKPQAQALPVESSRDPTLQAESGASDTRHSSPKLESVGWSLMGQYW